jgi:type IV fimbrial biogenesis protein FimT
MLKHRDPKSGFTLIELATALAVSSILLGVSVPSLVESIRNARIRTTAEAFQSGIQLARAEAVRRNQTVRFQITNTLAADCSLSTSGTNWVVSLNTAAAKCTSAPADPPDLPAQPDTANPYIIQTRPAAEGSANTVVTASQSALTFNGLGELTPHPTGNVTIDVAGASGTCAAAGGSVRCLRVALSPNGQVRTCDPAVNFSSNQPRGC